MNVIVGGRSFPVEKQDSEIDSSEMKIHRGSEISAVIVIDGTRYNMRGLVTDITEAK